MINKKSRGPSGSSDEIDVSIFITDDGNIDREAMEENRRVKAAKEEQDEVSWSGVQVTRW